MAGLQGLALQGAQAEAVNGGDVGAVQQNPSGRDRRQAQQVVVSDGVEEDLMGYSIAFSGWTMLAGAPRAAMPGSSPRPQTDQPTNGPAWARIFSYNASESRWNAAFVNCAS